MRVLAAGDHFVAPQLFDDALRAELGSDELDVTHLTADWPSEPFGPVGAGDSRVDEASGSEDDLIAALDGARVCLTQMAPFTATVFDACPELEMLAVCRGVRSTSTSPPPTGPAWPSHRPRGATPRRPRSSPSA